MVKYEFQKDIELTKKDEKEMDKKVKTFLKIFFWIAVGYGITKLIALYLLLK